MRSALPDASFAWFTGTARRWRREDSVKCLATTSALSDFGDSGRDRIHCSAVPRGPHPLNCRIANQPDGFGEGTPKRTAAGRGRPRYDGAPEREHARLRSVLGRYQLIATRGNVSTELPYRSRGSLPSDVRFCGQDLVVIKHPTRPQPFVRCATRSTRCGSNDSARHALRETPIWPTTRIDRYGGGRSAGAEQGRSTWRAKGLDITSHRARNGQRRLESRFMGPRSFGSSSYAPMWTTGLTCPSCSTIYLDKPMKNHTLCRPSRVKSGVPGEDNGYRRLRVGCSEPGESAGDLRSPR